MGVVMAIGAVAYVVLTVTLATRVIAPASRLSNAQDTRIGGMLADALGGNAVVKSFGAEAREDARLGRVIDKWSRRTHRTWMRHTWSGTGQLALLWVVRTAVTATGALAVVAGPRDARRNHVRADDVLRRARLPARHRPARPSSAARGERDGRTGAPVRRAFRRGGCARCQAAADSTRAKCASIT